MMDCFSSRVLNACPRNPTNQITHHYKDFAPLGPPRKLDPDQVETARRREKVSLREIGRQFRVSASTVDRYLKEELES